MSSPWAESTFEDLDEATMEAPYGESPQGEFDNPFAPAGKEAFADAGEYGQELYAFDGSGEDEWKSPFAETEDEVLVGPSEFPSSCADVTMDGQPWPHGLKNRSDANLGEVSSLTVVPRAEVFEFQLSKFDVDRHELKRNHRDAIADFTKRIKAGIAGRRYTGEPLRVFTYGETSSTASGLHNAALSRNRAFNALNAIRCAFKDAGITTPVYFGFYGTGEAHARFRGPDNLESSTFRGVVVRAFAPLAAAGPCKCPPGPKPPQGGVESVCITIPSIGARSSTGLPPGLIPLGSIIPGLKLPIAIVTKAQAAVRVEARRSRQSSQLTFNGWGLEVALPAGRTRVDIQADLRASLEVLVRASASLSAKLKLGPLGLMLRLDASAFAQLVVKLCAQLRLRLDVGLGRPNLPELTVCRPVEARNVRGAFPFGALAGPGVLIVPGPGYGPAVLSLRGPGVPGLGLSADTIPVPADKRTVRTLLVLGGTLAAAGAKREAESEWPEAEWPEAFDEVEAEVPVV
jgi:outer membrane protein OmpA-like peptidoglycan-associated protein